MNDKIRADNVVTSVSYALIFCLICQFENNDKKSQEPFIRNTYNPTLILY